VKTTTAKKTSPRPKKFYPADRRSTREACFNAAMAVLHEYERNLRAAMKKLIETSDGEPQKWCYIDSLMLDFRFKGVAVAEKLQQNDRHLVSKIWLRFYWLWINGR
jgi:hypothetical protein